MGRRIVLKDHMQKLAERRLEIDAGGETFYVDQPLLWPDTVDELDIVGTAKAVLMDQDGEHGEHVYDRYVELGGNYRVLIGLINTEFQSTFPES